MSESEEIGRLKERVMWLEAALRSEGFDVPGNGELISLVGKDDSSPPNPSALIAARMCRRLRDRLVEILPRGTKLLHDARLIAEATMLLDQLDTRCPNCGDEHDPEIMCL